MPTTLTASPAWQALARHRQDAVFDLHALFAADPQRFERFSISHAGLLLDFSKHFVTDETLRLLVALARSRDLERAISRLLCGEKVNATEGRAALHTALRANRPVIVEGHDLTRDVARVRAQMRSFTDALRGGALRGANGRTITDVVHIGIGGSDLGPALAVAALTTYEAATPAVRFLSNVDGAHVEAVLAGLDPDTTLAIVVSKTFSTQETLTNAKTVQRWLASALGADTTLHFAAVTANPRAAREFGVASDRIFEFWDWVGGRYSLWSAVGLPIAAAVGMDHFEAMCDGAREMDEHFGAAPLERNMPVVMALLGVWYGDFFGTGAHAVLPYDMRLERFPQYLQQLEMESNGKSATLSAEFTDYATCPVVWGAPGTNGQHAFFQMLHQGTQIVPADFIACCRPHHKLPDHHAILLANCCAQTEALMRGKPAEEVREELARQGLAPADIDRMVPHKVFPGNRPTSTLLLEALTPRTLGALIALYEHKVYAQSVIWGINAFDQWGVELGKRLADRILPELASPGAVTGHDSSTKGLLDHIKTNWRTS